MRIKSRRTVKFFVSFFLVYAVFLHWSGWANHAIFDFAKALVEEHRLTIDSYADNNVDRLLINGYYYSNKPIGAALLAVPSYALWKGVYTLVFPKSFRDRDLASTTKFPSQWYSSVAVYDHLSLFERLGRIFVTLCSSTLLGLLTVFLIYRFAGLLGAAELDRWLVALAFGFGTSAFYATADLFQDTMGMFFLFLGFYWLFQANVQRRGNLVLVAGIATGFSVTVSRWGVLAIPAYLAYLAMVGRTRAIPVFLLGGLVGMAPQLVYDNVLTGSFWRPAFIYYQDPEIWITHTIHTLGLELNPQNLIYVLPQVLFFPTRGLFFYCPILILSLVGIPRMLKQYRAEALTILMLSVIYVLYNAFVRSWWTGSFGSRYILSLIPFLTLPLVYIVRRNRRLFFALLVYSVLVNLSSTHVGGHAGLPVVDREAKYAAMLEEAQMGIIHNNPVYNLYLPRLLRGGPSSRILESFSSDDDAFDLRPGWASVMGFAPGDAIPWFVLHPVGFVSVNTRYLSVFLLVVIFSVLWSCELSAWLKTRCLVVFLPVAVFSILWSRWWSVWWESRYLPVFLLVFVCSVLWARELSGWLRRNLERFR